MVAPALNPTLQLAARCRAEPMVFDGFRSELCPQLEQAILNRMRTARSHTGSLNVGGWKSTEDFFSWPDEAVQELRKAVVAEVGAEPVAWAMVNRAGSHHPRHQHRIAILFGIYYVAAGNEDAITPTIFECPSDAQAVPTGANGSRYELEVEPHPGRLVLARGEMWHRLPPYTGDLPRITIAFDVRR